MRVRFADLRSVTRSVTLPAPISATAILAEIAEDLVRRVLANHPDEQTISLLAISVSNLEKHSVVQLELPLGLEHEERRPGTKRGMARWVVDRAVDAIRSRFGWDAVDTGRSCWKPPVPFPTSSANSRKSTYDHRRKGLGPCRLSILLEETSLSLVDGASVTSVDELA